MHEFLVTHPPTRNPPIVNSLATETVQSAALSLEGIDNVEGSDCLSFGVFGIGNSVANNALKEGLQNTASLFVDH